MGITNSFGLSVVTFTVAVKALLFPLNFLQLQSSDKMQRLQPTIKEIQKRYGRNKKAQQAVTSKLYEGTKVNPLAGCLPSFAQIPIFIGLYRALTQLASENIANEPFLWLPSLEGPVFDKGRGIQWLTEGWHDGAPALGWAATAAYLSIPVILVISQSVSMRMLSPPTDPNDESMKRTQTVLKYLPLMIGWFSLNVPAALGVYWMANNLITTASTMSVKAYFNANPPVLDIPDNLMMGAPMEFEMPDLSSAKEDARIDAQPDRRRRRVVSA
ncbi:unnamed protein product [Phaeothamnion confervicola]